MIDYDVLKKQIDAIKGTTFAGLTTKTSVKLKGGKKNLQQGRITKITEKANIMLFSNSSVNGYEGMVKRRMVAEGKDPQEFVLKPRPWGKRVDNSPFIEHNGKYYLECFFINAGTSSYFLDDEPIDKKDVEGLDDPKEKTETQVESQGGIDDKVILRTFALESILSIKIKSEEYTA